VKGSAEGAGPPPGLLAKWHASLPLHHRPVALITGFDGTHTARLALQAHLGTTINLIIIMESNMAERTIVAEKFG